MAQVERLANPWQPQRRWDSPEEMIAALSPLLAPVRAQGGKPLRVNSIEMSPLEMIESLETIAGLHGVGRIDLVATRLTGGQTREIYEAPAALVLHAAHRELEQNSADYRELMGI